MTFSSCDDVWFININKALELYFLAVTVHVPAVGLGHWWVLCGGVSVFIWSVSFRL